MGREHVRRARAFCRIREGIEGRKEGGILRIFAHFDLFIPQHLIHPLLSWRGLFSFQFISFRFPFFFFFFFFKDENRDGSGGSSFFSTRGRTETCAHNGRPASHVLSTSHVFIEGGGENREGLCISYLSIIIIGKARKAKKDGKLEGEEEEEEEEKNPEPRNTLASRLFD